jgi:regulator of extracellular matrix RemA (YlzA/DUF370 family)
MYSFIFGISLLLLTSFGNIVNAQSHTSVLATHSMPLNDRYPNKFVNDVFAKNILLDMAYLRGSVDENKPIELPVWYSA